MEARSLQETETENIYKRNGGWPRASGRNATKLISGEFARGPSKDAAPFPRGRLLDQTYICLDPQFVLAVSFSLLPISLLHTANLTLSLSLSLSLLDQHLLHPFQLAVSFSLIPIRLLLQI